MPFEENVIRARNINDAWRDVMWCCVRKGYRYVVKKGSYVGTERKQLSEVMIIIEEPWTRPLAVSIPEHLGFTSPTDDEKISKYFFEYLATDTKVEGEDYTYGQYIAQQLERLIHLLNVSKGNTNQAAMTIGEPNSIFLDDPPCLRSITLKVLPESPPSLQMSVFFRSWDLFIGLPENLGGLQLLKEYILMNLTFDVVDGPLVAYSDGLHIYSEYYDLVNRLNVDKI